MNFYIGIATFPGFEPEVIFASRDDRPKAESIFAEAVVEVGKKFYDGPATQSMLVEVPREQFVELASMLLDIPQPRMVVIDLAELLGRESMHGTPQ